MVVVVALLVCCVGGSHATICIVFCIPFCCVIPRIWIWSLSVLFCTLVNSTWTIHPANGKMGHCNTFMKKHDIAGDLCSCFLGFFQQSCTGHR